MYVEPLGDVCRRAAREVGELYRRGNGEPRVQDATLIEARAGEIVRAHIEEHQRRLCATIESSLKDWRHD